MNTDLPLAARLAHEVVSTAGNIGIEQVSALARLLETACLANSPTAEAICLRLVESNAASFQAIDVWLSRDAAKDTALAAAR